MQGRADDTMNLGGIKVLYSSILFQWTKVHLLWTQMNMKTSSWL